MELLDVSENKEQIESIISNKGYAADHNYYNYIYNCDTGEVPVFFRMSDSEGIMAYHYPKDSSYRIFSDILADKENRLRYLVDFLDKVKSLGAKKVEVETDAEFRSEMIEHFKKIDRYRVGRINLVFTWPIYDMAVWDGDLMQGKDWKDIRYYWNKYFKEHKVEFKTAQEVDGDALRELVLEWKKQRTGKRVTFYKCYMNAIDNGFAGFNTRIMIVDGKVSAMTAGFKVPNKNYYYSSIGIYSRDIPRTGEICNMDDLMMLKKKGYESVDFGGGEESLMEFKQKFKPTRSYKTYIFSILLNDDPKADGGKD